MGDKDSCGITLDQSYSASDLLGVASNFVMLVFAISSGGEAGEFEGLEGLEALCGEDKDDDVVICSVDVATALEEVEVGWVLEVSG